MQILTEDIDGSILCHLGKRGTDLTLDGRADQTGQGIGDYFFENGCGDRILILYNILPKVRDDLFFRKDNLHLKDLLRFTTIQSQNSVTGKTFYLLFEFIIILIYRLHFRILSLRRDHALLLGHFTDSDTIICNIRQIFRQNILSAS